MSEVRFRRPRHQIVAVALAAMDRTFLAHAQCYFGGGTRIVLELDEYRESEDIDFLCASRDGYRALRSTVTNRSLGEIMISPLPLAREVRAYRYGIRTFLDVGGHKVKMEIVNEGRIGLHGESCAGIPVPCLDKAACFAEKFLANADRGDDNAALGRDVIDLAFMVEGWGEELAREGAEIARETYGESVDTAVKTAAEKLIERKDFLKRCVSALAVTDKKTLASGLERLANAAWVRGSGE
ncbi:MAG: nucleotidyl transferase AbiEii/AbiGii toxin family protein [Burkholderiales bacterium]